MLTSCLVRTHLRPHIMTSVIISSQLDSEASTVRTARPYGTIDPVRSRNQVLKESHGKKRILLNDEQRRRLAVKGQIRPTGTARLHAVGAGEPGADRKTHPGFGNGDRGEHRG